MAETVALLFSDLAGSTELLAQLGAEDYGRVLSGYRDLVEEAATAEDGEVVDREGDGLLLAFPTAGAAIRAAAAAQRSLAEADWPVGSAVVARMGVHVGEVVRHEDGYVGLDVHRAARVGSAAHGGQVVVTDAARALAVDALEGGLGLRDLGEHRLKGLDRTERMHQLVAPGLREHFPPPRTSAETPTNLPEPVTRLVGRDEELVEVARLVHEHRLVTLAGPGGVGKTRLALAVGRRLLADLPDGVWFVGLAPVRDADLVADAVADALGVTERGDRSVIDTVLDALSGRTSLLVVDNCEHLVEEVAELTAMLLSRCGDLRVLATSREPLHVAGEHVWDVPSLVVPAVDDVVADEGPGASGAVALFVERAREADPDFELTPGNATSVVEVCRRLDGIPLAIELAAARLRSLDVAHIAERLDDRFRLLTGGPRTALAHHRTLEATLEWSHELLEEDEQVLFRRLGVFAGPFTLESCEAVCGDVRLPSGQVVDLLDRLVDRSLVTVDRAEERYRYRVLETVRAYGEARLEAAGEHDRVRDAHVRWFAELAAAAADHLRGPDQRRWLDRLDSEYADLRAALRWAVESGDVGTAVELATALGGFWARRPRPHEAMRWIARVLDLDDGDHARDVGLDPTDRAALLRGLAQAANAADRMDDAVAAGRDAVELARRLDDEHELGGALWIMSLVLWRAGRGSEAHAALDEAIEALERAEPGPELARIYAEKASFRMLARDTQGALEWGERAVAVAERFGEAAALSRALNATGSARLVMGDTAGGRDELQRSRAIAETTGLTPQVASALTNLGSGAGEVRDYGTADPALDEAIAYAAEHDLPGAGHYATAWRARTHFEQGEWDRASQLAERLLDEPALSAVSRLVALTVLGRVRVRRGESDADRPLDGAWELATGTGDLQRLWPVAAARAESAWLGGEPDRVPSLVEETYALARRIGLGWAIGELGFWAWRAGVVSELPAGAAEPFALHVRGELHAAAEAWRALGCPYEAAETTADIGDPASLRTALAGLRALGAWPAADVVEQRLRRLEGGRTR